MIRKNSRDGQICPAVGCKIARKQYPIAVRALEKMIVVAP